MPIPIIDKLKEVRQHSVDICQPLKIEDYVVQPVEDVSPPKWHLGHTTWFFEEFILVAYKPDYKVYHKDYSYLFNSYYQSAGERVVRSTRGNLSRPTVKEVMNYRKAIDQVLFDFLEHNPDHEFLSMAALGIHHEQQHQELLLTDIKYILAANPLLPVYSDYTLPAMNKTRPVNWLSIEEGICEVGYNNEGFCYDNETPRHKTYIQAGYIMDRLVTNGEYLEFIQDQGYEKFHLWLSDGWAWIQNNQVNSPLYWKKINGEWYYFTLHGLRKMDMAAPVCHISYYEADAYARWKGMRLPTEFEWEIASLKYHGEQPNISNNDYLLPKPAEENNTQFIGDVWEWTASAYLPYPGYKQPKGAIGEYNGKFMINQMVLRGGSCITPAGHIRNTYRNFFQTEKRWQFQGFRLVKEK
jgi:ergothioneine biosynthesis protein EgtB